MEPALTGEAIVLPAWQSTPLEMDPMAGIAMSGGRLSGTRIAVAAGADLFVVTTPEGIALVPGTTPRA